MRTKRRTLKVNRDFALSRANYRSWADDLAVSVLPFFVSKDANQTPALALGKSVGKRARRALVRAFRRQRERITIHSAIPRSARCVAVGLSVLQSGCSLCGQPSKEMEGRLAFFISGKPVDFLSEPRRTLTTCPACGTASEGPVRGPATGSYDAFLREADGL